MRTIRAGTIAAVVAAAVVAVGATISGSWWLVGLSLLLAALAVALVLLYARRADSYAATGRNGNGAQSRRPLSEARIVPRDPASRPASRHRRAGPEKPVALPATADPYVVVEAMQDAAAERAGAVASHLWLEDPSSGTLRLVAAAGPMAPSPTPVPLEDTVLGRAVESGEAILEPEISITDADGSSTLWRYAVPIGGEHARGVAAIDLRSAESPDAEVLVRLTATLRAALYGALFLHVARAETAVAHVLLEAAEELSRRITPDDVIERTLARALSVSNAATGSVMLTDEAGVLRIAASKGLPDEVVAETAIAEGEGIAGWVLATRRPLLVEDLPGRPSSRRHGVRSAVSVPIADDDGALGVLNVGSRTYPARFTDTHLKALEILARQTAVALRNARAMSSARELYFSSLTALAVALETKDPYARGNTGRVVEIAVALGQALELEETELQALHVAAILHDVGMNLSASPPGVAGATLSTIERGLVKSHPLVAAELLTELPSMEHVVPIVYHHHEWFDGHGYVGGLAGEDIPPGSRILAVADAFVAMTSARSYRRARSVQDALDELADKAGTQFDPDVVEALDDLLRRHPELAATALAP